jgi:hypothetical protein
LWLRCRRGVTPAAGEQYHRDMTPDYTKQLEEIARALSRPGTPEWLKLCIPFFVGSAVTLLVQFVQRRSEEHSKRERARRVLYIDLAELFLTVEGIMECREVEDPHRWAWQKKELRTHVAFKREKYLRANEDAYVQLAEHAVADNVYTYFHKALDDLGPQFPVSWALARQVFAHAICKEWLEHGCFRRFVGKKRAESLISRCKTIDEEAQRRLSAMGLNGTSP